MKRYTRTQRRRLRRNADTVAPVLARTTLQRTTDGRLEITSDPIALAALERGFRAMLRGNLRPIVQEITAEEGAALRNPGSPPPPPLPGIRHWAAFGIDVAGHATSSTTWTWIKGAPEAEVRAEAERIALEHLAKVANKAGLPMEAAQ
jgi:hypothetical protein